MLEAPYEHFTRRKKRIQRTNIPYLRSASRMQSTTPAVQLDARLVPLKNGLPTKASPVMPQKNWVLPRALESDRNKAVQRKHASSRLRRWSMFQGDPELKIEALVQECQFLVVARDHGIHRVVNIGRENSHDVVSERDIDHPSIIHE